MLESFNSHNEMQYQKLSAEEQQRRGILGRLAGVLADFKKPTRNGRLYSEELWDKQFNNPIMKEKIENKCLFGELGHPEDRQEVDMEKIAICLAEFPKKGSDGKLYGVFDIIDTPNGRILKTLCDYGCNIGVSSRGSGDVTESYDGNETVDPDTYECECWDAVLVPSVKAARPKYVTESLQNKKDLKIALQEALETANENDKKIMEQTLDELNVDYFPEQEENNPEKVDNIEEVVEDTAMAAENDGAAMIQELQEALKAQVELENKVKTLQEKLSVCYTKEARYSDVLTETKHELAAEKQRTQKLSEQLDAVNSKLEAANKAAENAKALAESQNKKLNALNCRLTEGQTKRESLSESLNAKDLQIKSLTEQLEALKSTRKAECDKLVKENKQLAESLESAKKDIVVIKGQQSAKLNQAKALVEKYQEIAKVAVDKYIGSQARRFGISANDVKSKLGTSYSFKDIDRVCESLQQYKLTANSLPFSTRADKKPIKMTITESKEPIQIGYGDGLDDEIDPTLKGFI